MAGRSSRSGLPLFHLAGEELSWRRPVISVALRIDGRVLLGQMVQIRRFLPVANGIVHIEILGQ